MASTTNSNFGANTEAIEVAKAFPLGIKGKTILITGANLQGIGGATARAFASQSPKCLILAGRSPSKISECINSIKEDFPTTNFRTLNLDLSSQTSIRAAAKEFLSWSDTPTLDILVNSAGVMGLPSRTLTPEGIEMHFGSNHIGHFLFTNLIIPKLISAASTNRFGSTRIINVSSLSPLLSGLRWSDINFENPNNTLPGNEQPNYAMLESWGYKDIQTKCYVPIDAYNRSKVANLLFSIGLNKHYFKTHGILSLALHPGIITTELHRDFAGETLEAVEQMRFTVKTLGAGAATSLVAALDPGLAEGVGEGRGGKENYGTFLMDCQICEKADPRAVGAKEAERLWGVSEGMVGERFG